MHESIDVVIPAYNAANVIDDTIKHIVEQEIPGDWDLKIYVVDDASTDCTLSRLRILRDQYSSIRIIETAINRGRSAARNRGVDAGSGSIVILCDADCRFTRTDAIAEFVSEIQGGADAVIGLIELEGDGFWARYTNSVTDARNHDTVNQGLMAYTTQNFAIKRGVFERLSGYSGEYEKYGFEDRDFLIRLEELPASVVVRNDIRVSHDDDFSIGTICRKVEESGRYSAAIFRNRFPDHYRKLPYARCDATRNSATRFLAVFSKALRTLSERAAHVAIAGPLPGFRATRFLVRIAVCAAYFHGTANADD